MKIRMDIGGAIPARPDFGMLRAGMIAAQAATPTALASLTMPAAPISAQDALTDMFGPIDAALRDGLGGRFSMQPDFTREGDER